MRSLFLLAVALCVASASAEAIYQRPDNGDCVVAAASLDTSSADLFPSDYYVEGSSTETGTGFTRVSNALGFSVTYYGTYKVVNNSLAGEVYVLSQCGVTPPSAATLGLGSSVRTFEIPLTSVAVPETVPYAFLELLGVTGRVHSVSPFVVSPCGQFLVTECAGGISNDFSSQSSNATWLNATFLPTTDGVAFSSQLTLPTAFTFSAASETSALARVEWIKFLGLFFNLDSYASQVYDAIAALYEETAATAAKAVEALGGAEAAPVGAFVQHFTFEGMTSSYQISFAPYKLDFLSGASVASLNATEILALFPNASLAEFSTSDIAFSYGAEDGTGYATQEEARDDFLAALATVDVLIDETFAVDPTTYYLAEFLDTFGLVNYTDADAAELPWLANLTIFREDGLLSAALGLDWFEGALVRADKVLHDFVRAAHGAEVAGSDSFTWIRSIHEDPVVVGPEDCAATKGLTGEAACAAAPATICPYASFCADGAVAVLKPTSEGTPTNSVGGSCAYAACASA